MPNTLRKLMHVSIANLLIVLFASSLAAQSTDQNFPTPVRDNEVASTIKARDVGDARLTSHFYTFEGGQGDLFINVQTTNFSGDVDVYAVPGLRPLSKMVMYADASGSETGRVIYLRKPETILLRISGRTPGDEEATYRIKFAGSFVASKAPDEVLALPKVDSETQSNVRVNSVGTIIEVIPKATPAPKEEPAPVSDETVSDDAEKSDKKDTPESAKGTDRPTAEDRPAKAEVIVSDPLADKEKEAAKTEESPVIPARRTSRTRRNSRRETEARKDSENKAVEKTETDQKEVPAAGGIIVPEKNERGAKNPKTEKTKPADPMAGIRLVIRFKNGGVIERPMTEVSKFTVERAVLTVISRDGTVGRYQMIEVSGVTIE
jgi:hypothetical protein